MRVFYRSRFLPVGMFAARKRDEMRQEEVQDEWKSGINKFVEQVREELVKWKDVSGEGGSKLADMMASVAKIETQLCGEVRNTTACLLSHIACSSSS